MNVSPDLFRAAFEEGPYPSWLVDPSGAVIAANRATAGAVPPAPPGGNGTNLGSGPDAVRLIVTSGNSEFEQQRLAILEMAARGEPLEDTLATVASVVAALCSGAPCAILLLRDDHVTVAASRRMPPGEREALAQIPLSWLTADPGIGVTLKDYVLRLLVSAAGEVLGALVLSRDPNTPPESNVEARLAALESIAVLAIEHSNLLEELTYRAQHDSLTRVWNRVSFDDRLSQEIFTSRQTGARLGVLYLDLDHFRLINDVVGHQTADVLLRQIAGRFQRHMRPSDFISRAGGDEFLFLVPHLSTPEEAHAVGERLLASLEAPFLIGDHELCVTASIGISVSQSSDVRVKELESRAYTALEHAKRSGRNQVAVFDSSMTGVSPERLALEQRLRQALPNGELLMNYQPQIDLATGIFTGAEALLRWKHPELGLVSPGTFIPIAEENGLICSFGEFALYEALRQAVAWRRQGLGPVRIGVNVSPLQFCRPDFARRTIATVQEFDIDPSQLELEITEGVIMQNVDAALAHMNRLREIGVQFSIDDFGTGHSSLAYLQKLPIQRIKIDRSFVKDIAKASERPALVTNIIRLAHALGVPAIVEGIETLEQAIALTAMGCEEGQGYLFSKPLTASEFLGWAQRLNQVPAGQAESLAR